MRLTRLLHCAYSAASCTGTLRVVPLLSMLLLLACGCSSTHQVSRTPSDGYSRVTEAATGKTARVYFWDSRIMQLQDLYVGPDSTTGTLPQGNQISFSTSTLKKVELVDRGTGFLEGVGIGAVSALGSAVLGGFASDGAFGAAVVGLVAGAPIAFIGGLTGGVVGGVAGHQRTYLFPESSPPARFNRCHARHPSGRSITP